MQLFVKDLNGKTSAVHVSDQQTIWDVKMIMQILLHAGRQLSNSVVGAHELQSYTTLHMTSRLCAGKPVKIKMMTNHLPCGPEVTIDMTADTTKEEIKQKLVVATGVPMEHQKIMMSGITQICMGDKRTNIGYGSCGSTSGFQLAINAAK